MSHAIQLASESGKSMSIMEIADLLAQALGQELAEERVLNAAADLGITSPVLSAGEVSVLLGRLSEETGAVGLSATLAKSRLHFERGAELLGN